MESDKFPITGHVEEFYDINQKEPTRYSSLFIVLLFSIVVIMLVAGFVIEIPDIFSAEVQVTSTCPPVTLKAQSNGKLHFIRNIQDVDTFKENEYIALIENAAKYEDVLKLKSILRGVDTATVDYAGISLYRNSLMLGEIAPAFNEFNMALDKVNELESKKSSYLHNIDYINRENQNIMDMINNKNLMLSIYHQESVIKNRQRETDSILYHAKVISKQEYDNTLQDLLTHQSKIVSTKLEITQLEQNIILNEIKLAETKDEYTLAKEQSYNLLSDALNAMRIQLSNWEKTYAFIAPHNCRVELANIVSENNFVSIGDPVVNIIGASSDYYGVAILSSERAGSVHVGDSVNIRIAPYPYQEYGVLKGYVKEISKNVVGGGYLAYIALPQGIITDNGYVLSFAENMSGEAQIITGSKKLIFSLIHQIKGLLSPSRLPYDTNNKKRQDNNDSQEYK